MELEESGKRTIDVEMVGLRVGDCPTYVSGELTVQIGLNLKTQSHLSPRSSRATPTGTSTTPTQVTRIIGGAQEDDCILAPDWQLQFERAARSPEAALTAFYHVAIRRSSVRWWKTPGCAGNSCVEQFAMPNRNCRVQQSIPFFIAS